MDANASAEAIFRKNSRSFSLAARFFDARDQQAVARMYCFCRYLDDLADDTRTGDQNALDLARSRLTGDVEAPATSIEADFLALARERMIPLDPALELIDALREDCGARSIQNSGELIRFAYGVAGTVGRMLRHVINARDERADAFAIDLGIGLQLSNIVRDITEDARRGRFYLPAEWVEPDVISRAMAGENDAIEKVDAAVRRTLNLSELYYHSARRGFALIPPRNRHVIFIAAALYQEIGRKVMRNAPGGWRERTVVGAGEKLMTAARALREYQSWQHAEWTPHPEPRHDSTLHSALI